MWRRATATRAASLADDPPFAKEAAWGVSLSDEGLLPATGTGSCRVKASACMSLRRAPFTYGRSSDLSLGTRAAWPFGDVRVPQVPGNSGDRFSSPLRLVLCISADHRMGVRRLYMVGSQGRRGEGDADWHGDYRTGFWLSPVGASPLYPELGEISIKQDTCADRALNASHELRRQPLLVNRGRILNNVNDAFHVLESIEHANIKVAGELLPLVSQELRHFAARRLAEKGPRQTLQPTPKAFGAHRQRKCEMEWPAPFLHSGGRSDALHPD